MPISVSKQRQAMASYTRDLQQHILLLLLCFLVEKTTLSGEGIIKLLLSSTCICFTAWQQDKQFAGDVFCTSSSDGDSISDSETFLLGFDISFVPGGNTPSGVGYSVLSAVPKLMMSLGTAIWMTSG